MPFNVREQSVFLPAIFSWKKGPVPFSRKYLPRIRHHEELEARLLVDEDFLQKSGSVGLQFISLNGIIYVLLPTDLLFLIFLAIYYFLGCFSGRSHSYIFLAIYYFLPCFSEVLI
jgi:hypothetical protein